MESSLSLKNSESQELFQKNCDLLLERYPKLAFLIHGFSSSYQFCLTGAGELNLKKKKKNGYDYLHHSTEIAEELRAWRAACDWEKAEVLYLYGLGLGYSYLALKPWLQKKNQDLIYLEDDSASFIAFLRTEIAESILKDPKVHLYFLFAEEKENLSQELADSFPLKKVEVLPAPHRLGKKQTFFSSLRLEILRRTTLSEGLILERIHSYIPFANTVENAFRLPSSFFINQWKGKFAGIPMVLCGAGPSLKKSLEAIKRYENKALLMAGGSAITALTSQSVLPHLGVMVDPNVEEYHRLKASFGFEVPMVYHLRTKPEVFTTCSGPLGYMRSAIASLADVWIEEELGVQGPFLGEDLSFETLSVTALSLSLAVFLGCNPIILCGVDLAYTQGARYAEGVVAQSAIDLREKDAEKLVDERVLQKIHEGRRIKTNVKWMMESSVLSSFAKNHPERQFFNASFEGLPIDGIPFRSLQDVMEEFSPFSRDICGKIFAEIEGSLNPNLNEKKVSDTLNKLYESVLRCKKSLEMLLKGAGSKVLLQMELEEEIAFRVLFYDLIPLLSKYVARVYRDASSQEKEHQKWHAFDAILYEYSRIFQKKLSGV